ARLTCKQLYSNRGDCLRPCCWIERDPTWGRRAFRIGWSSDFPGRAAADYGPAAAGAGTPQQQGASRFSGAPRFTRGVGCVRDSWNPTSRPGPALRLLLPRLFVYRGFLRARQGARVGGQSQHVRRREAGDDRLHQRRVRSTAGTEPEGVQLAENSRRRAPGERGSDRTSSQPESMAGHARLPRLAVALGKVGAPCDGADGHISGVADAIVALFEAAEVIWPLDDALPERLPGTARVEHVDKTLRTEGRHGGSLDDFESLREA